MEQYLCISVTFLDPLYHGKGDSERPEWPPSPMRLFQAMLAGSRAGNRKARWVTQEQSDIADAFTWLERQSPPMIVAPHAERARASYTLFVPNNDSDEIPDRQDRLTSKYPHPHRLVSQDGDSDGGQTIHYLWAIAEKDWAASRPYAELMAGEARCLIALGWGIDQAVGNGEILTGAQADQLHGERWQSYPSDVIEHGRLRVPKEGSLRDLELVHESFCAQLEGGTYSPPMKFTGYDMVRYVRATEFPSRPYVAFELPDGCAFRQEAANEVAAMLRSLACREQNRDDFRDQFGDDTEVYLAGHVNGEDRTPPRFSYLPLPTIGHQHADGMVRRLLIAEPYGGDGARARWSERRLGGQTLTDNKGDQRGQLLGLWRRSSRGMVRRYAGEHRVWSSVTPVILPGFDDGKLVKAERLFLKAVQQAGISVDGITDVTLRKAPFWPGSQHPRDYRRPKYLRHLPAWHAQVEFRQPVSGPLAIGAGRHTGLGVMAGRRD